jgi:NAD(P)-dependent dehydrogenase (short-subunit alcohol dehydrogenase family)
MEDKQLKGKIALITGAYQNLGAVTAERLALEGANVIINDLDRPELKPMAERLIAKLSAHGVEAVAIGADLSSSSEVRRLCRKASEQWGRVDILVNNAGPFNMDPYLHLEEAVYDRIMGVNLKAVYLTAQELVPQMKKKGWGRIINMCAGSAFVRNHGVYTLAKAGVQVITESLAQELGPEVTVNAIAPGQIRESLPEIEKYDPSFGERYTARAPLKRLVTRAEIARLIALLCSPAFDTMTGMTFRFDGGAEIPRF